jgi:Actinobacteria/chloroflexi VLRF1 release factor
VSRPAAGGGRWVEVDPDRLGRWLDGFGQRHGGWTATVAGGALAVAAADGARAWCHPPPGTGPFTDPASLQRAAAAAGRIGLLLARRGAVAVGVAEGTGLVASKVDSRYVQGRTAAGGWSQQRFARRRANQAKAAAQDASDIVAAVLLPAAAQLAALVTGGDRRAVDAVLADPRLGPVAALRAERFLNVPEPKLAVLSAAVRQARAVRVRLVDPDHGPPDDLVE